MPADLPTAPAVRPPRSWGRLVLSLAATVASVALVATSAPSAGAGDPAAYDPPDVYENIECDPKANANVPEGCEAHRPPPLLLRRLEIHERMAPQLRALFGERFGGVWGNGPDVPLEHHRTYWGAVNPTPEERARFDELRDGEDSFILVAVARSLNELQAIKDQVMEHAIRLGGDHKPQVIAARVELSLQKVVLDAKYFEPAWVAEMYSQFPPEVLEIRVSPYVVSELMHTTRTDYPPYEGGLGLTVGGP